MKRFILLHFPLFISGIILGLGLNRSAVAAFLAALLFFVITCKKKINILLIILFIGSGYVSALLGDYGYKNLDLTNRTIYYGYICDGSGRVFTIKEKNLGVKFKIYIKKDRKDITPGECVKINGQFEKAEEYKRNYYYSEGIAGTIRAEDAEKCNYSGFSLEPIFLKMRYSLSKAMEGIDPSGGSFIASLVTGYSEDISEDQLQNFKDMGLTHIIAISGFNIGIVYFSVIYILRKCSYKLRYAAALCICTLYTMLGAFEPSITRAYILILLAIYSKLRNKSNDMITSLTAAGYVMLAVNPYLIYNNGFLLSFSATYGLILLQKGTEDFLMKVGGIKSSEAASCISAFIATFPEILNISGCISLITVPLNIILAPFVAFITVLGFISSAVFAFTRITFVLMPAVFSGKIFLYMVNCADKINFNFTIGKPSEYFVYIYYIFIIYIYGYIKPFKPKGLDLSVKVLTSIVLLILLFYSPGKLKIVFINVGQGDSALIETPERKLILVDTGPSFEGYSSVRSRVLPEIMREGYNKLDMLIITHFHNDHSGDYKYLYSKLKAGTLCSFSNPDHIAKFHEEEEGDKIKVGSVLLKFYAPSENETISTNENEKCLVFELIYKNIKVLFTADAEKNVLDKLSGNYAVYKVQHHGSDKSFSEKFIQNSTIDNAVISVGRNSFGHPSLRVLKELQEKGINIYRTDREGNIVFISDGINYTITRE